MTIEEHPLQPFLPQDAKMLFLGSFPPPKTRWSMDWFYPNWINDFWRIQGVIHFDDKNYFEIKGEKRFDKERIMSFCKEKGMAFFDTARKVCRLKDNADDNFLDILEPTDVFALLHHMPSCSVVVTTGGKASEEICTYFNSKGIDVKVPKVGENVRINSDLWTGIWWRMPSSSRAYPMKLEKKAEYYKLLFS